MKKRKIAIITGSRGEYGIYCSVIDAIIKRKDVDYTLIVTCMHLSKEFGHTIDEIKKGKRKIGATVDMLKYEDTGAGMAKNFGVAVIGITRALEKIKPDMVLVLGDRGEQLAGAIAGSHMNIPVAHLHGGEVSGTIDESIRHAITKFSHIHLAATKKSVERLIRLGEKKENIHLVGSPGIDAIKKMRLKARAEIAKYFNFNPKEKIALAVQYPVTSEIKEAGKNMRAVADALVKLNAQTVYIYSNSDAGYTKMMKVLRKGVKGNQRIKLCRSLPHETYLSLMKNADVMIGNSSSGVIEAPSCNTPYVLVGTRQSGREKAKSIIQVDYNAKEIVAAAKKAMAKSFREMTRNCEKPYDPFNDAKAGERAAKILAKVKITPELIQKKITY